MCKSFKDDGELVEFYQEHKVTIMEQYHKLTNNLMSQGLNLLQKRSYAYFAVRDFIFSRELILTECQLNRITALMMCEIHEKEENNGE